MEIDCENEKNLKEVINKFDFQKQNITYDGVDKLYFNKYKITKNKFINLKRLDFDNYKRQLSSNKTIKKTYKQNKTRKNNGRNKSKKKTKTK